MPHDPLARLINIMLPFHNHFRHEYATIVRGIPRSQQAPKAILQRLVQQSIQLCHHLEMHHTIEEAHFFPVLAKKIPSFAPSAAHTNEHALMHAKLEQLEAYSNKVLRDLRSSPGKRAEADGAGKELNDGDGTERKPWPTNVYDETKFDELIKGLASALFPHLEAEEASLQPDNLRKFGITQHDIALINH